MARDYFKFQQFTVHQHLCAMKVGTDGTLLGAWANVPVREKTKPCRVLDIGTGTGLVALMMAQRFSGALVVGIDIDPRAAEQAAQNAAASPFASRVRIIEGDVRQSWPAEWGMQFDAVVCNPPYFDASLECPDGQRNLARHTSSLSYHELMEVAWSLLSDEGELSLVIPFDYRGRLLEQAGLRGFHLVRQCAVKTTPYKAPRRYLLAFRKHPVTEVEQDEGVLEEAPNVRSEWYRGLTNEFYL